MKKILFIFSVLVVMLMTSCATVGTPAGVGIIYTDVQTGITATDNKLGTKTGTAEATNILGIVATGDASIQTAAKSAGITEVTHVDQHVKSILGIYAKYTTIVYGN